MKGIFYIHNNRPVIATERKPEVADKAKRSNLSISEHTQYMDWLMRALKEWERQLIPAENVYSIDNENRVMLTIGEFTKKITPGQAIGHNNGVIHEIIQT